MVLEFLESEDVNGSLLTPSHFLYKDVSVWELSSDLKGALLVVAIASEFVCTLTLVSDFSILSSCIGLESSYSSNSFRFECASEVHKNRIKQKSNTKVMSVGSGRIVS